MKVTVTDYLRVRVGKPSLNAPSYQYLAPGSTIEVEDSIYDGDIYEGSKTWIKDLAGNYYWAGAIKFPTKENGLKFIDPKCYEYWHLKNFDIKKIHDMGYRGQGINICVIDSGISKNHNGFDYTKITIKSFVKQVVSFEGIDDHGHGTKCAGIIASNGQEITGIVPESNLFVFKGYAYSWEREIDMINAIENVPSFIDVISISYVFTDVNHLERLTKAITKAMENKTIVVVAHGNSDNTPNLASSIKGVISVGALNIDGDYKNNTCTVGNISILGPGVKIYTTDNSGGYSTDSGTSFATPFVASICALIKQINRGIDNNMAIELITRTKKVSNDGLIKIIDPLTTINQLITI